jgi:hypothetical protein
VSEREERSEGVRVKGKRVSGGEGVRECERDWERGEPNLQTEYHPR